jgi:hypothetical protein
VIGDFFEPFTNPSRKNNCFHPFLAFLCGLAPYSTRLLMEIFNVFYSEIIYFRMVLHGPEHPDFHSLLLTLCLLVPVLLAPWDHFLGEQFHCAPDRGMVDQPPLVEVADKFVHVEFLL